jgi:hypothetical protein
MLHRTHLTKPCGGDLALYRICDPGPQDRGVFVFPEAAKLKENNIGRPLIPESLLLKADGQPWRAASSMTCASSSAFS